MKAFLKTYWLELALFAVALVGEVMVLLLSAGVGSRSVEPSLARLAPKWSLLFLAVMQFAGACLVRFGLHAYFERYPARALTFGSLERLVPLLFSVALILCQLQFSSGVLWPILSCAVCPFSGAGVSGPSLYWPCPHPSIRAEAGRPR